jgi:phosphate-selective porin OprO/OprP
VGILAEYAVSSQEVRRGSQTGALTNHGWQVSGSLMITGEPNGYSGVRPKRPFEPQKGLAHLGGWELKLRYSRVEVDAAAFPVFANPGTFVAGAGEWVTGVNWHLHRHARLLIDYERTRFRAPFSTQQPHTERALLGSLQLAF